MASPATIRSFLSVAAKLDSEQRRVVLGVCAMDKKTSAKPMQNILTKLKETGDFDIIVFGDETIIHRPVEEWPHCDALISFFSEGFPLNKAEAYANLRKPFLVNDTAAQHVLLDRRKVYAVLREHGIPVPPHIIVNRTFNMNKRGGGNQGGDGSSEGPSKNREEEDWARDDTFVDPIGFCEEEDSVSLDGVRQITKPFVEKPISGEDHNVNIYYPMSVGGGMKKLFRKIGDRSSEFVPDTSKVRRNGSFLYEAFLATGGVDVKVYTVGPEYAHAEARKSPVVDGKVLRDSEGKEQRFPVLLSPEEKEIARKVSLAFRQRVCGFDLLRCKGKSYVCDVNGWSFVKNSEKYYEDAATTLRTIILSVLAPSRLLRPGFVRRTPFEITEQSSKINLENTLFNAKENVSSPRLSGSHRTDSMEDINTREELRCVICVCRHADRTPKQKLKMKVTQEPLLMLLRKYGSKKRKEAKLKSPQQLQELLDAVRGLLSTSPKKTSQCSEESDSDEETEDAVALGKLERVREVLEQGRHFSGIYRKAQLKPLRWRRPVGSTSGQSETTTSGTEGAYASGGGGGSSSDGNSVSEALLVMKWGGVLTPMGRKQSEAFGRYFRHEMYPNYGPAGGGLLRLHSTYRHDLKIYSSDEGRVQMSAAAYAKGLLDLEGELPPILVSLVKKDASMLDAFGKGASHDVAVAKTRLYDLMTADPTAAEEELWDLTLDNDTDDGKAAKPRPRAASQSKRMDEVPAFDKEQEEAAPITLTYEEEQQLPWWERPGILPESLPSNRVAVLQELLEEMRNVTMQLKNLCESADLESKKKSSVSLEGSPEKVKGTDKVGSAKESVHLMYERWKKLEMEFSKKARFDISKIPDIYDSAKYDHLHSRDLHIRGLERVYTLSRTLADVVIPNEYGNGPLEKLKVGSKICAPLLGKILTDLSSAANEGITLESSDSFQSNDENVRTSAESELHKFKVQTEKSVHEIVESLDDDSLSTGGDVGADEDAAQDEDDAEIQHKLDPKYAMDINTPQRHVRTRIYFTSESHIHSLVNVLRFCHLPADDKDATRLCSLEASKEIHCMREFDYLSHIIIRLYENVHLGKDNPRRYKVNIGVSGGMGTDPESDMHVDCLPTEEHEAVTMPLISFSQRGATLEDFDDALRPYSMKWNPSSGRNLSTVYSGIGDPLTTSLGK